MKKVSVIVPVYNSQEYLRECADSLVNQTLEEIEIIFVNDGSTDESLKILEEYQSRFPEKVIIRTKENGGQATARNLGIGIATGEYIGFVDSDDSVDVKMYEEMYEAAIKADADYVECNYKYLQVMPDGGMKELQPYGNVREYKDKKQMFIDPLVSPWNKIYKSELLKQNGIVFPEGVIYEDTAFFIKSIPYINKAVYVNEDFVYHFLRENSTMNAKKDMRVGNIFVVLQDIIDFYANNQLMDIYQEELEYFCVKILLCSSLSRVAKVSTKELQRKFVKQTLAMIKQYFADYRKNLYLAKGGTGLYMKCVNALTIHPIVTVLRLKQ